MAKYDDNPSLKNEDDEYAEEQKFDWEAEEPKRVLNWPVIMELVAATLVIAILLTLAGRWAYHSWHGNGVVPAPASTKNLPQPPSGSTNSGTSTSGSLSNNSSTSSANGQMPNTGPGNIATIFLASSFAAGSLHYVYTRRKRSVS